VRLAAAAMACGSFLGLLNGTGHAQVIPSLSEVSVTVVDQIGALIDNSEVVFKSDSKAIVARPVEDKWWIKVGLPSGKYDVTVSKPGFLKAVVPDFEVVASAPNELKVVLWIDPNASQTCGLCGCSGCVGLAVPATTSELPNAIPPDPEPASSNRPVAKRTRSWRCLYLWKCSGS
jgi:hypothetical protein